MTETYQVRLEKEQLIFSAAHFITFAGNICERIHGHNYRVRCEVTGRLDENGYVVDFIALRDALLRIVRQLDHKMLLPTQHPTIEVESDGGEIVVRFEDRRWVFPADNCQLLPVANTTAELLARYIAEQLMVANVLPPPDAIERLAIGVDENEGQWGVWVVDRMG